MSTQAQEQQSAPAEPTSAQAQELHYTPAEAQFHTSSIYPKPLNWDLPVWKIHNDYPAPPPSFSPGGPPALPLPDFPHSELDAPWLEIDFRKRPDDYARVIREYCWEGNRSNDFVVQKNKVGCLNWMVNSW